MAIDREKALDRVRKLLNHAKSDGERYSEAEVENYLRHARKLMDEFNIKEDEALGKGDADKLKAAYESIVEVHCYSRAPILDAWMISLAHAPASICDVKVYLKKTRDTTKARGQWRQYIVYYGLPRDVDAACELYKQLLVAARTMCKVRYGEARPTEYRSYCQGFADRVSARASELKTQSTEQSFTTAIILAKDAILDRYTREKLNLKNRRSAKVSCRRQRGYVDGLKDGANVDLSSDADAEKTTRAMPA